MVFTQKTAFVNVDYFTTAVKLEFSLLSQKNSIPSIRLYSVLFNKLPKMELPKMLQKLIKIADKEFFVM